MPGTVDLKAVMITNLIQSDFGMSTFVSPCTSMFTGFNSFIRWITCTRSKPYRHIETCIIIQEISRNESHTHTPHTHTQNTIKTAKNRLDKNLTILLSSGSQTWQKCSKMLSDIVIFCKVRNQRRTMNNPGYPAQKLAFKRICYASIYGLWMLMARSPMSLPFTWAVFETLSFHHAGWPTECQCLVSYIYNVSPTFP